MAITGSSSQAAGRLLLCACRSSSASSSSSSSKLFPSLANAASYAGSRRAASSKPGQPAADRDVPPTSAFTDAATASAATVASPEDAGSAGSTGSPASPAAGASMSKSSKAPRPMAWLNDEGLRYKRPLATRTNWLGRTPFPLNPSFKPPTPISNVQKTRIYKSFVAAIAKGREAESQEGVEPKSETYYARQLALQYGLSIDRIKAIVRLKALEQNMSAQGSELQMQFLRGMEEALGVSTGVNLSIKEPLDIAQETGQKYGVGKKTSYIMLDEENLEDVQLVESELQAREELRSRNAASVDKVAQSTAPRKQDTRQANSKKSLKRSKPVGLQYTDIPGKAPPERTAGGSP